MPSSDVPSLVDHIQKLKKGRNNFTPYIDYMVFPRYRRIAPMQRVSFTFPLTVLVGRNGTGKSSILHALYGAPEGQNVAHFWFGTAVDPYDREAMVEVDVEEAGSKKRLAQEQKAAFWYGYLDDNIERQAIKQRVRREKALAFEDQENWEPTRPIETYGMKAIPHDGGVRQRHPQIKMAVDYLNLRYQMSAFDRCFHFWSESSLRRFQKSSGWKSRAGHKAPKVQDYIRQRAVRLGQALDGQYDYWMGYHRFAQAPQNLSSQTLAFVSQIVGKTYKSGRIIRHRLYDDAWAYSVRFDSGSGAYTEANAGSGETAVVQIVRLFENAKKNSLLLLDEPETSLHPGAQRELLKFILEQISEKRLQVVLSTHAPELLTGLPRDAVKVMRRQSDGLISIDQELSPKEVFYEIGQQFDPSCNVIVEDRLAKTVLVEVAKTKGPGFAAKLRVEYRPGGDGEMKKDIAVFMHSSHKPVFVFDGDKRPIVSHVDPKSLAVNQQTAAHLDWVIKAQTGQDIRFQQNSGMTAEQKGALRASYLTYYLRRVFYLPFASPEQAVWSDDVCRQLLVLILGAASEADQAMATITAESDFKKKFDLLSRAIGRGELHPTQAHSMFVTRFVATKPQGFQEVSGLLDQVVAAAEADDA